MLKCPTMRKPIELFIGLRYLRARRRDGFISFTSTISLLGIMLGVMALITVMSVMNGFVTEVRDRMLSMTSHVLVTEIGGKLSHWQSLAHEVEGGNHILAAAPYIEGQAMLTRNKYVSGALVQGILPEAQKDITALYENIIQGSYEDLQPGKFGVLIGSELAYKLALDVGDKVTVITPQAAVTPAGVLPRLRRFEVVGIFEIGMQQYDRGTIYIHIQDAAKLYQYGDRVSGVRLLLDDLFAAPEVTARLNRDLGLDYWVRDWAQMNPNYFKAVRTEKTMMFILLALIIGVAAFNIVSTLMMVVTDKQADIAILRTIGATPGQITRLFIIQGSVIGLIGTVVGVILGVLLSLSLPDVIGFIEELFQAKLLAPDVYYISDLPTDVQFADVVSVAIISFVLTLLSTLYPSIRASKTQPAEALRYE